MRHTARARIIRDNKLLLVTAHDAGFYWTPGGGLEGKESPLQALHRELQEELSISVRSAIPYLSYIFEGDQKVDNFLVTTDGEIITGSEITGHLWYSRHDFETGNRTQIAKALQAKVIPQLIKDRLLL